MDEMTAFERQLTAELGRMAGPGRYADASRIAQTAIVARGDTRMSDLFGRARLGAAMIVVGLSSGVLLMILLSLGDSEDATPAAVASPSTSPRVASTAIHWQTEEVDLTADAFTLDINDLTFTTADGVMSVSSDPGRDDDWTLEIIWIEHEREQRLNMYFGSDGTDWWVDEIRTYDGHEPGEWVYAYGPLFRSPLGLAAAGDVSIDLIGEGRPGASRDIVTGTLRIDGLQLAVFPSAADRPGADEPMRQGGPSPAISMGPAQGTGVTASRASATAT